MRCPDGRNEPAAGVHWHGSVSWRLHTFFMLCVDVAMLAEIGTVVLTRGIRG